AGRLYGVLALPLVRPEPVSLAPGFDAGPVPRGRRPPAPAGAAGGGAPGGVLAAAHVRPGERARERDPARLHVRPAVGGVPDRVLRAGAVRLLEVARDRLRLRDGHHCAGVLVPPEDAPR